MSWLPGTFPPGGPARLTLNTQHWTLNTLLVWDSSVKEKPRGGKDHVAIRDVWCVVMRKSIHAKIILERWNIQRECEKRKIEWVPNQFSLSSETVDRSNIVGPLPKLFESRKESQWRLPSTKVDICSYFILLKIQFWGHFLLAEN